MKPPQILVIGYSSSHCTIKASNLAYQVGEEIAKHKATLITGGLGGVMEAASRGAKNQEGLVVGIIPQEDMTQGNLYNDVIISTGIGYARNFITAYSADAVIVVGGGAGTLTEACAAYLRAKPIIAVIGSGGVADHIANTFLDDRKIVKVIGEISPVKAVKRAIQLIEASQ